MEFINLFVLFILAYLFGSFPSAFLIMKWFRKRDIRNEGSGNVGTLNVIRVSKNKWLGLIVLILDLVKGALPAWYFTRISESSPIFLTVLVCGVLVGHVFPVWLRFKGGRGLAVTAGALLVIEPLLVAIWVVMWFLFFLVLRKHIIASMIATFSLPLIVYFLKGIYFTVDELFMILPVSVLIIQRHLERVPDLIREKRISINNGDAK